MSYKFYLFGDFGGTNTQLRLLRKSNNKREILFEKKYFNKNYKKVEEILINFKEESKLPKNTKAAFAIARTIDSDKISLFNNDFVLDKKKIIKLLNLNSLDFINDLEALGHCIDTLKSTEKCLIKKSKKVSKKAPKLIISSGTGLGISVLINSNTMQSAGGHTDFPFRVNELITVQELKLVLKKKIITYEDIVSGRGIKNLYKVFSNLNDVEYKNSDIKEILNSKNKISSLTKKFYSRALARFVKNNIITTIPFEGVYLAGGIIQKNGILDMKEFEKELESNSNQKLKERINEVSIYIIKNYNSSLDGLENYLDKK